MTLVKFKNKPLESNFSNLFEDFFEGLPTFLNEEKAMGSSRILTPVNIQETENEYLLDVIAPGFEKADFIVNIEKNLLTISAEKENEKEEKNELNKLIRKEYDYKSFNRSFTLDDKIDSSKIEANYKNGVLTLNLPKKPEVKAAAKQITVK